MVHDLNPSTSETEAGQSLGSKIDESTEWVLGLLELHSEALSQKITTKNKTKQTFVKLIFKLNILYILEIFLCVFNFFNWVIFSHCFIRSFGKLKILAIKSTIFSYYNFIIRFDCIIATTDQIHSWVKRSMLRQPKRWPEMRTMIVEMV